MPPSGGRTRERPGLSDFLMLSGGYLIRQPGQPLLSSWCNRQYAVTTMNDLIFVTLAVAFFVACAAYAVFCEKAR